MPRNNDPMTFKSLSKKLEKSRFAEVKIANNTVAYWIDDPGNRSLGRCVGVRLWASEIIRIWEDGTVWLHSNGYKTETTKRRMNAALDPLGLTLGSDHRVWKVYDRRTWKGEDFLDGVMYSPMH